MILEFFVIVFLLAIAESGLENPRRDVIPAEYRLMRGVLSRVQIERIATKASGRVSSRSMEFIPHEIDEDVFVLMADGGINRENAKAFTDDVEAMVANGFNKLIIDCSKLDYISSSGLGTLLVLHKRMKAAGGDVKLCSLKGIVAQALQLIRLDHLFGIYADLGQARLAFRPMDQDSNLSEEI